MFDRMTPLPSARRSTTAAAVSSQVVSIPSTTMPVTTPIFQRVEGKAYMTISEFMEMGL
jgi:hypothetical protein